MDRLPTPFEALTEAVNRAGSQTAFAEICGVSQPAVWKWLQSIKRLPPEHCIAVEASTGVSRHYLRPDIYPITPGLRPRPMHATPNPRTIGQGRRRRTRAAA